MRRWWLGAMMLSVGVAADAQEWISPPPADPSPITDHMAFSAIWFFGKVSSSARIDPTRTQPGSYFDVEQQLGLTDKAQQFRAQLDLRLASRNRIRVGFLDLRRNGDTTVGQTLVFGPQTFESGQEVKSEVNYQQFDVAYTYSFLRGERYELGAGLGLQFLQADVTGFVPNTPKYERFDGSTPFGEPLLDGTFLIAKHWSFNARGQYLHLAVGGTSGVFQVYHADVQYRYHTALALGIGYEWQEVKIGLSDSNPPGVVRLRVNGPEAFLRASF
jgi:hypothetical protein